MGGGVGEGVQDILGRLAGRSVDATLIVGPDFSYSSVYLWSELFSIMLSYLGSLIISGPIQILGFVGYKGS